MCSSHRLFILLLLLFQLGTPAVHSKEIPAMNQTASLNSEVYPFANMAKRILGHIHSQESKKDATCWTTVRLMENFYTGIALSERSVLLKIEVSKTLMYRLWESASLSSKNDKLNLEDIQRITPGDLVLELLMLDGAINNSNNQAKGTMLVDYHKVTENWRVMLSLLYDYFGETGFVKRQEWSLKPISPEASLQLAKLSTVMTVNLLKSAKEYANDKRHEEVEPGDIKLAYEKFVRQYRIDDKSAISNSSGLSNTRSSNEKTPLSKKTAHAILRDLTLVNIDKKIASLKKWNKPAGIGDGKKNERKAFEKILQFPITDSAYSELRKFLTLYGKIFAAGITPARFDTYTYQNSYERMRETFPASRGNYEKPTLISLEWALNILSDIWPKKTLTNGDIALRLASNFSGFLFTGSKPTDQKEWNVVLWASDADATRDTAIHWSIMQEVWQDPNSIPLDPFAAEVISESISELALLILVEAKRITQKRGFSEIDKSAIAKVFDERYTIVPHKVHRAVWNKPREEMKKRALENYSAKNFIDISSKYDFGSMPLGIEKFLTLRDKSINDWPLELQWFSGSGIAAGDFNNDDLVDIFVSGDGGNILYKNNGNYEFEDVSKMLGVVDTDYDSRQSLFVDVNNDRLLDLFIVHSDSPSKLYIQQKSGKFVLHDSSGITTGKGAHTAFFFDYDNDGFLDLFIGYYGASNPNLPFPSIDGLDGRENQLFHNEGGSRFRDVSEKAGVDHTYWTLAGGAMDINHDGYIDFFLANDFGSDALYLNDGKGAFKEVGQRLETDDRGSGMNVSFVDVDNDDDMDVYVTVVDMFSKSIGFKFPERKSIIHLDERILKSSFYISGNKLYRNKKGTSFTPVEHEYFEPVDLGWSWGAAFFDYENDGDEDMYLANGWVDAATAGNQKNIFFIKEGGYFYKAPASSPEAFKGNSRSVVALDMANNGKLDIVVSNYRKPPTFLKNNSNEHGNNWIKVKLSGNNSNSFGVGAKVKVIPLGKTSIPAKLVTCGIGYLAQDPTTLTFGIGKEKVISQITVTWPNGIVQNYAGPFESNRAFELSEK